MPQPKYEVPTKFYLGRLTDPDSGEPETDEPFLYESKDLVTHAVCVGMTGSGKTGLGVTLLEEAAIDKIPALVIDPKGDLTNLLLTFPDLLPSDFEPWMQHEEAKQKGMTLESLARERSEMWKAGLADWDQGTDRVHKLKESCEFNIFTPGSDAGIPLSILSSFQAPSAAVLEDGDLFRDRVSTTATSLLTLLGIDADPIRSREHILLTTILDDCWRRGQSVDLGVLIQLVQSPPVAKIGVMDLENFFPADDRFELAMAMNNLLASPGFSAWLSGAPLDIPSLLHAPSGKPRISIFYTAHLSESERMFFTSLLLNETLSWLRSCSGTGSLRALLYLDEIFGYMPPVAQPPTKKPLLTLLKQARAYGLGLVLATQNPVDLDYKGLSNTGTWFLGRLQTEQDRERVLDGLEGAADGAAGGFDRRRIHEILSGIGKRIFLMHNVHEDRPVTFQTRWALSYLAGPMTRIQIKSLMADRKEGFASQESHAETAKFTPPQKDIAARSPAPAVRPSLPPDIPQVFLPLRSSPGNDAVTFQPRLLAVGQVHFVDTRKGLATDEAVAMLTEFPESAFGAVDWDRAKHLDLDPRDLVTEAPVSGVFKDPPSQASEEKNYREWEKSLAEHIYRHRRSYLLRCKAVSAISEPGETERDFRIRIADEARSLRDERIAKIQDKYASKLNSAAERVRKAELRVDKEEQEASGAKMQNVINIGATLLSAVLGRRRLSATTVGRAATTARGYGRASKQADDVRRAAEDLSAYQERLELLEEELEREIETIRDDCAPENLEVETLELKPRRTDIDIRNVGLAWVPVAEDEDGDRRPLYR